MNILDCYKRGLPSDQSVLDIFSGEWSSAMPDDGKNLRAGAANLFNDARIKWAAEQLGGFAGYRIVELGPLEAGHSYMMENMGAESVLAIESSSRAYLKCLIVKELFNLQRCRFLMGDFVEYLKATQEKFDICLASGVLYHMRSPVELISLIAKVSDKAMIWTHYYDEALLRKLGRLKHFSKQQKSVFSDFNHSLYKHSYGSSLRFAGFCGGSAAFSNWMTADDILAAIRYVGFQRVEINFHQTDHPNGPAFCIVCEK